MAGAAIVRRPGRASRDTLDAQYLSEDTRVPEEFTLDDARAALAALRAVAPDDLRLPLSPADLAAILAGGIEVKSVEEGLLDFPTSVEDAPAYWCWRVGESEIEWWHPRDTGFAGRRPIAGA